jgi:uncharacterized membrane protein
MTKKAYLEQLDYKLRVLPYSERKDALEYYDGYISDGNGEENAMAQLGSPGEVAAMILANYLAKGPSAEEAAPSRKNGLKTAWLIILAIFAVPVGLPLIISLGAAAFALFVALGAVVVAVGTSGVAIIVAGLGSLIMFPFVLPQDVGFGLITAGMGLAAAGLGIWLVRGAYRFMGGFAWIARFVSKKIIGRNSHGRPAAIQ